MLSKLENNLAYAVNTLLFWRITAAIISAILLAIAFPPLNWSITAWFAMVPVIIAPQPRRIRERLFIGYLFGYIHFAFSLFWLNEVGFGAGFLLSIWCALFPMAWYCLLCSLLVALKNPKASHIPGESILFIRPDKTLAILSIIGAASWTALEWIRSWLFTGFSWNQLGISQYQRYGLVQTAAWTGPYGASFLIVLVNMVLAAELAQIAWMILAHRRRNFPWHFATLAVCLIPVGIVANLPEKFVDQDTPALDALVIQPDLPQARIWTEEEYLHAIDVLHKLTENALKSTEKQPDLVVWPECAVPAPLNYPDYRFRRNTFLQQFTMPFLIGATHPRITNPATKDYAVFNCAFLIDVHASYMKAVFDPADHIIDYYDKIHRVPFGEFTPFGKYLPWLVELIGMGRDLTPGKSFHVFDLPNGARAGVNICFEDVFPYVSREFVKNGANILMTITNDSWYNRSCAAHQHMAHVVFRAVENRRPFLRCGSNSHSCLVSPNGRIHGLLRDDEHDSDFVAATRFYNVPVKDWGTTFYTKYGDIFARLNALLTLAAIVWLCHAWTCLKKERLKAIEPNKKGGSNVTK
ncbi:MAG: apolipoprotein N-acyltransferase [Lentisphaeria bacterium]|nr:apolipoprotein N-acyltransferase [Lentisphaeria bacterium]